MKNILKKESVCFVQKMEKSLLELGAVPFVSDKLQFDLKTKYGVLWLRIDTDNKSCYTVYARFVDVEKIKDLDFCNTYSGKWNHHLSGNVDGVVRSIVQDFKSVIN